MTPALVLPFVAAVIAALTAGRVQRRLPPRLAAPVLTFMAAVAGLSAVWAMALIALGYVVQHPALSQWAGWCRSIYDPSHSVPAPLGILAAAGMVLALAAGVRADLRYRRARAYGAGPALEIIDAAVPVAFAIPGRPGRIIVSGAMLRELDADERRVLLAHEQAHLDHHHHRYVRVADTVAAAVPILRPLAREVRFAVERWADERAAEAVGDRRLVARAIARAALAKTAAPIGALGMSGGGVRARVDALLAEPAGPSLTTEAFVAGGGVLVLTAVTSSTVQLHHFLAFAAHVCRL